MDLLDRYLQAVRFWLPRRVQDDIGRELAEDIRSEIEEKEAQLGRPLAEPDLEAILLRRGSPIAVATRYLPSQSLIGPLLLPLHRFVLRVVLLWVLLPLWILLAGPSLAGSAHPWKTALAVLGPCVQSVVFAFGMITLVFAVLERVQPDYLARKAWDPRKLPAVRSPDRDRLSRTGSAFEVIFNGWFLLWWAGLLHMPFLGIPLDTRVHLVPAPIWQTLYWPVLVATASIAALGAVNLVRPWWTPARAAVRLANQVATIGLAGWLLHAGRWIGVDAPTLPPGTAAELERATNLGLQVTFLFIIGLTAIAILRHDLPRLRRLTRAHPTASAASAPVAP